MRTDQDAGSTLHRTVSTDLLLEVPSAAWAGLPVALYRLPGRAAFKDLGSAVAGVAVARSGRGTRRVATGQRWHELSTAPGMVEMCGENAYWDRFEIEGEPGEIIGVELPAAMTTRWLHESSGKFNVPTRHEVFDDRIARIIHMLWDAASNQSRAGALYAEGLSLSLLGLLLDGYCEQSPKSRTSSAFHPSRRARLLDFIDAELGSNLTVERIAQVAGVSPFHFSRQFRQTFGQSPYAFVLERRIESAADELRRRPDMRVSEIALKHGFYSQQHFTEAFKRTMRTTPTLWRKGDRSR